jgi:hypothetical protein
MNIKYKCAVCGKELMRLLPHIRTKVGFLTHGITPEEYYLKYIDNNPNNKCAICGKETKFNDSLFKYEDCCSIECRYKLRNRHLQENLQKRYGVKNVFQVDTVKEKIQNTSLERYNVKNPGWNDSARKQRISTNIEKYGCEYTTQADEVKAKSKETCLKKYGVEYSLQSDAVREKGKLTKIIKYGDVNYVNTEKNKATKLERHGDKNYNNLEKAKQTCLEKYGTENPNSLEEIKEKIRNTNIKKFGCSCYTRSKKYKLKRKASMAYNFFKKYSSRKDITPINVDTNRCFYRFHCNKCNTDFSITPYLTTIRDKRGECICINCNKIGSPSSRAEKEIYDYLIKFYTEPVELHKRILDGKELDIYVPEKNIAIEYDGVYWHNELMKEKNYHLWKTEECNKRNIQLIHIFEDEWKYKQEIVKSRLKGLLGLNDRIYARKTECRIIDFKTAKEFLDDNHIQGSCVSKYNYGLFCNDELVSVMTFGNSRFKDTEFELLRFANKLYTNVIGGASKLFCHFRKDHPEIEKIVSYADRRWSKGNLYEKLGFEYVSKSSPSYYYVIGDLRHNRIEFQKHKLVAAGADPNKSEHDIMLEKGIYRIYDCGNLKYEFKIK